MNGPDDLAFGPDGSMFWTDIAGGDVVRVDVDSGLVETVATGFQIPAAVKFDSQGRLHVLDTRAGEVVRVDVVSGDTEVVGRPEVGRDNLAFDGEDRLFVSSFADGSIVEVTGPETIREVMTGGISSPGGLAYVPSTGTSGRLFLADGSALRELNPVTGAEVHVAGGFNSDLGQVMSVHRHGEHLLLCNSTTVTIWDPAPDRLVSRFDGFEECVDAVAYEGDIIVSQYNTGSVIRFDPASPDDRTVIATGLEEPAGLAVQGANLYVADRSGTLFQILDDGETLETPRPVASGLAGPEGIAAAEDGTLYVVEEDAGRVTRVNPQTGTSTPVVDGFALRGLERRALAESTSIGYLSGVAVGNGTLFVSDYQGNRVYRIEH